MYNVTEEIVAVVSSLAGEETEYYNGLTDWLTDWLGWEDIFSVQRPARPGRTDRKAQQ